MYRLLGMLQLFLLMSQLLLQFNFFFFLQAQIHLVSVKDLLIPRLKLLGCLIGAWLLHNTIQGLIYVVESVHLWTDSSTALAWIKKGNQWSVFVQNRVKEMKTFIEAEQWRYVPGAINPADLAS